MVATLQSAFLAEKNNFFVFPKTSKDSFSLMIVDNDKS